jgi:hypothetical protein
MPNKLSTTLCMKEGLTYLMVTIAYHLPYFGLLECDEPWLILHWEVNKGGCWVVICGHVDHHHHHGVDHVLHCGPRDMISSNYP